METRLAACRVVTPRVRQGLSVGNGGNVTNGKKERAKEWHEWQSSLVIGY